MMKIRKFRKKTVVEAVQLDAKDSAAAVEIAEWCGGRYIDYDGHMIRIRKTPSQVLYADHGDWIVKVGDEFHVRKPGEFDFEPATPGTFNLHWIKPLTAFGPEGHEQSRLHGTVRILDVEFNVNAEEVTDIEVHGKQFPTTPKDRFGMDETFVSEIQAFTAGPAKTVQIEGRQYLLAITPYSK